MSPWKVDFTLFRQFVWSIRCALEGWIFAGFLGRKLAASTSGGRFLRGAFVGLQSTFPGLDFPRFACIKAAPSLGVPRLLGADLRENADKNPASAE